MFDVILITVFWLYLLLIILAIFGLRKKAENSSRATPFVTVVVPARNEAGNIGACIESLLSQNYPANLYEIIIINDGSEDETAEIVRAYQEKDNRIKLRECNLESSLPPGKSRALESGIRAARGDIVFNTDADCVVSAEWLSGGVTFYKNRIAMVNGVTLPEANGWFSGIQQLDFAFLHGVAAGFSGVGLPLAGMGNNMSYRRESYQKTGGFEKLGFSVTEDFQLTRAFLSNGEKVIHIATESTLVLTKPVKTFREFYNQKKRWAAGGLKSPPIFYFLFLAAWLSVLGVTLAPVFANGYWVFLLLVKVLADFALVSVLFRNVKKRGGLRYFLPFELYLSVYVLAFPLIIPFSRTITWKGRIFR